MRKLFLGVAACLLAAGCAATKPETVADLNAAYNVAAAADAAYVAHPGADPQVVAGMARLLTVAQAALVAWSNSALPADQAAASAAIAALVAYQASAL